MSASTRAARLPRSWRAACASALLAVLAATPAAYADTTAGGQAGQTLTVSKTANLDPAGETVTVSGEGYDVDKGIYLAFCVDNGPGAMPTPCGGGADLTGSSGASVWISSNPPSYGEGLAIPYGEGGAFQVEITVSSEIGDIDCASTECAIVTRTDHTRTDDRSQDVRVPITFRTTTTGPVATPSAPQEDAGSSAGTQAGTHAGTPQVAYVETSTTTGRWWTASVVTGSLMVLGLLVLRARRRRTHA